MSRRRMQVRRDGFSLIEVAVTTVIVALGVTALLISVGSGTKVNGAARNLTQAVFLAQEIREWTVKLPFSDPEPAHSHNPPGPDSGDWAVDDLDDLMNVTYSPPRDARGTPMTNITGWSQKITVTWRNPDNLASVVAPGSSDVVYVQVDVAERGQTILTTLWLVTRRKT